MNLLQWTYRPSARAPEGCPFLYLCCCLCKAASRVLDNLAVQVTMFQYCYCRSLSKLDFECKAKVTLTAVAVTIAVLSQRSCPRLALPLCSTVTPKSAPLNGHSLFLCVACRCAETYLASHRGLDGYQAGQQLSQADFGPDLWVAAQVSYPFQS